MTVTFEIPGKPFAKQRPRSTKRGHTYTPPETVAYEKMVGDTGRWHFKEPLQGAVVVIVVAIFKPAKSWSKKKRAVAMGEPHTQTPDKDNIEKAILDGLNKIAYADDSQVAYGSCLKIWGEEAKTIVTVRPFNKLDGMR